MTGVLRYKQLGTLEKNINFLIHVVTDYTKCDNLCTKVVIDNETRSVALCTFTNHLSFCTSMWTSEPPCSRHVKYKMEDNSREAALKSVAVKSMNVLDWQNNSRVSSCVSMKQHSDNLVGPCDSHESVQVSGLGSCADLQWHVPCYVACLEQQLGLFF